MNNKIIIFDPHMMLDENMFKRLVDVNVNCVCSFALWNNIELQQGIYDFKKHDEYINLAHKCGIKLIIKESSIGGQALFVTLTLYKPVVDTAI